MDIRTWLLFCATETVLCFTPGPAVLLVVSQSLSKGSRAGLSASAGILAANAAYFALSAAGLGALLARSVGVFVAIKWAGAAYLIWLGANMILERRPPIVSPSPLSAAPPSGEIRNAFALAVVTQGVNPKALVF